MAEKVLTPLKAIRAKCLECSCGQVGGDFRLTLIILAE